MADAIVHGMLPKGGVHDIIRGMLRNDLSGGIDAMLRRGAEWGMGGGRDRNYPELERTSKGTSKKSDSGFEHFTLV